MENTKKLKWIVLPITWLSRGFMDFGWGNGYVVIPKGHPLHGKHYDDINSHVDVHGGWTFSQEVDPEMAVKWEQLQTSDIGSWIIGFDTAHSGDTLDKWPRESVEEETIRAYTQILNMV